MTGAAATGALLNRARDGDRVALARLITLVEREGPGAVAVPPGDPAGGHLVGVTGPPGAGKSSLVGALVGSLVAAGRRPAVLAVDPSSPLTEGAILGDRLRMHGVPPGDAFVRSMASRGHAGGLALAVPAAARLLAHARHEPVIIETAGVGQGEADIAQAADTTVLVTAPGLGDAVQANKAGLLELADVLVVNKADRAGADDARRDLEQMLDLGRASGHRALVGRRPPVLLTVATRGEGVGELCDALRAHRDALAASGELARRRRRRDRMDVARLVDARLRALAERALDSADGRAALAAVAEGRLAPAAAAARIARRVAAGA